jgi:hypothetical protein
MVIWEAIGITLVAAPIYDWAMAERMSSHLTSFEYQYWPPSRVRIISFAILVAGVFASILIMRPPDDRLWPLMFAFAAMIFHGVIACADLFKQRREVRKGEREAFPNRR